MITVLNDGTVSPIGIETGTIEWKLPPVRESVFQSDEFSGVSDFGSNLGMGEMTMRGAITYISQAERISKMNGLKGELVALYTYQELCYECNPTRLIRVKLDDKPEFEEHLSYTEVRLKFKTYPYWTDLTDTVFADSTAGTHTIFVSGTVMTPFVVSLTGSTATPSFTVNGNLMAYGTPLVSGDILIIDTDRHLITKNASNAYPGYTGFFPMLVPGNNTIVTPSGNVSIIWRNRYL